VGRRRRCVGERDLWHKGNSNCHLQLSISFWLLFFTHCQLGKIYNTSLLSQSSPTVLLLSRHNWYSQTPSWYPRTSSFLTVAVRSLSSEPPHRMNPPSTMRSPSIEFCKISGPFLHCYLDAAHADDLRTRRSTTGFAFILSGGCISLKCKTLSTNGHQFH
jgi:hypothetical protein